MEEEELPITVEDVLLSTEQEEQAFASSGLHKGGEAPVGISLDGGGLLTGEEKTWDEIGMDVMGFGGAETQGMDNVDVRAGDPNLDFRLLDVMEEDGKQEAAKHDEVMDIEVVELSVDIFDAPDSHKEGAIPAESPPSKWSIMEPGDSAAGEESKDALKDAELILDELELAEQAMVITAAQEESPDVVDSSSRKRKVTESESPIGAPCDAVAASDVESATAATTHVEVIAEPGEKAEDPPAFIQQEDSNVTDSLGNQSVLLELENQSMVTTTQEKTEGDIKTLEWVPQPMEIVDPGYTEYEAEGDIERSTKKRKTQENESANAPLVNAPDDVDTIKQEGQPTTEGENIVSQLQEEKGKDVVESSARKRKSSDSENPEPALKPVTVQHVKPENRSPDTPGQSAETAPGGAIKEEGKDTTESLSLKKRKKRRGSDTISQEFLEKVNAKGPRALRHQVRVSTYDESLADATIEQHLGAVPSRAQRRKRKLANSEKAFDAEATMAAAIGFPRESLTEEEVEAGVVLTVGSQEQANYIVVRNHILAKWRENVNAYLEQDTVMESIRAQHKSLVSSAYKFLLTHGYINFGVASAIKAVRPAETNKASVIIIGAGLAGLGAARQLIAFGHKVLVLEGRQRPGGRVYTKKMEGESLMASADLGGSVITGIEGNPLGVLARQLNIPLHKIRDKCPLYQPNGLPVKEDVDSKVETQFNQLLDGASKWREDMEQAADSISLGATLETLRQIEGVGGSTEERQLYDWHLANLEYANAGLLTKLSLAFWDQDDPYEMGGDHCFLPGGNVKLIQALAEDIPILYGKRAETIKYGSEGVKVCVGEESYDADMALCTVPLGVLQRGMVKFDPELPQRKQDAVKRLGFGLLNKVVMLFPKVFWGSELDMFGHLAENPGKRGEYFLFYSYATVSEGPLLLALVAGEAAIEFEQTPPLQAVTRVMNVLRGIYEPRGIQVPNPVQTVCTRWGSDYLCYGSYSNVAVGASGDDYDILAESVGDGRLFFAGEATIRRYPATMHGAYLSGLREAGNIAAATIARQAAPKGEQRIPKDMHLYSSTLGELFKEPDLEFGSISVIFDHQTNDPKSIALVRLLYGGAKRNKSVDITAAGQRKGGDVLGPEQQQQQQQQLHLYTTITRQQAYELREVRGGDSRRFAYLCHKLGVKLVGRRGLGPQGDALVVAIKWHRATKKSAAGVMRPPKLQKPVACPPGASPK